MGVMMLFRRHSRGSFLRAQGNPVYAGHLACPFWIPACAGMTNIARRGGVAAGLIFAAALAAGCVTREGRVFAGDASPEAALQARVQLARDYIGEGNWAHAKRNLLQAAAIDPDSPEVHEAFALVYQHAGEHQAAEESFRRALRLRRDFPRARNNYAAFLSGRGRWQEAARELELVAADTLYEARPQAFFNLGLCRARLGELAAARAAFERALALQPGNQLALLELAHIEFAHGDYPAAGAYLNRYRESMQPPPRARALWLGIQLAARLEDADGQASRALALRNLYPESPEYGFYLEAVRNGEL